MVSVGFNRFVSNGKLQLAVLLTVTGISSAYSMYHDKIMVERGRDQKDLDAELKTFFLPGSEGRRDYAAHVQTKNAFIVEKADKADFEDRSSYAGQFAHMVQRTLLGDKFQRRQLTQEEEEWLRADDQKLVDDNKLTKTDIRRTELKWQWYDSQSPLLMENFIYAEMKAL